MTLAFTCSPVALPPVRLIGLCTPSMGVTLATQSGMTNQWLADQGLVSIQALWVAFHYPPTAAKG